MSRVWSESSGGGAVVAVKRGVPDAFSRYLAARLRPGDRVQPLDWTGGAVHGMLQAKALPATRFLYTFHFYHHVDSPFIRRLRKEFVDALSARPPRFLLEATDSPVPHGKGTSDRFEEFDQWREAHYRVVASGDGYRIWELKSA